MTWVMTLINHWSNNELVDYTLCTCRKKTNKIQLLCELNQGFKEIRHQKYLSKANVRGAEGEEH